MSASDFVRLEASAVSFNDKQVLPASHWPSPSGKGPVSTIKGVSPPPCLCNPGNSVRSRHARRQSVPSPGHHAELFCGALDWPFDTLSEINTALAVDFAGEGRQIPAGIFCTVAHGHPLMMLRRA